MSNGIWVLWVILGGILIVAEVFTPGFVLLWFGIGALALHWLLFPVFQVLHFSF